MFEHNLSLAFWSSSLLMTNEDCAVHRLGRLQDGGTFTGRQRGQDGSKDEDEHEEVNKLGGGALTSSPPNAYYEKRMKPANQGAARFARHAFEGGN